MRQSLRQSVLIATAIVGFGGMAAVAAPPTAGDPTATGTPGAPAATPSAPASAQTQPNNGQPNGGRMEANIEQRITDLQTKLQISATQKPQWDRFTQVMRDNARDMDKIFQTRVDSLDQMTAEQNMKSYADIASHHARDVEKLVPAFDALYAKMSESQKKMADQVFRDDALQRSGRQNG